MTPTSQFGNRWKSFIDDPSLFFFFMVGCCSRNSFIMYPPTLVSVPASTLRQLSYYLALLLAYRDSDTRR
ncbi:hypothetical protein V1264_011857 [Littorina saxatilis]|uniref:Uncharacterized protein n=1 Tax=Littorina saxatilis TaxID=31220 RepID=A0AAN9BVM3_9CAEN